MDESFRAKLLDDLARDAKKGASELESMQFHWSLKNQEAAETDMVEMKYKKEFFKNMVHLLENASYDLEVLQVKSLADHLLFSKKELRDLIALARQWKITTFIVDENEEKYPPESRKLFLELENIIANNRRVTEKKIPVKKERDTPEESASRKKKKGKKSELRVHLQLNQQQSLNQERSQEQAAPPGIKVVETGQCLNLKKLLESPYYWQQHSLFGNGNLLEAWYSIFGRYRESFELFYVTPSAAHELFTHYSYFQEGLSFTHLLQGFYLSPGNPKGIVLCFDAKRPAEVNSSPLTVRYEKPRALRKPLRWTFDQFHVASHAEKRLNLFFLTREQFDQDKELLLKAFAQQAESASLVFVLDWKLIKRYLTEPANGRALLGLLQSKNLAEVINLLRTFDTLGYTFKTAFLDNTEDWSIFLSASYQNTLTHIKQLQGAERVWWETLSAQHMRYQPHANIDKLLQDFRYFVDQYHVVMDGEPLPEICPFDDVKYRLFPI